MIKLLKGREGEKGTMLVRYDVKYNMRIEQMEVLDGFALLA